MLLKHEKTLDPPGDMFQKKKFKESVNILIPKTLTVWASNSNSISLCKMQDKAYNIL